MQYKDAVENCTKEPSLGFKVIEVTGLVIDHHLADKTAKAAVALFS